MTLFSANLGFLWTDVALDEAIRKASQAGFDAVECHWPYAMPAEQVNAALADTSFEMLSLNTSPGHVSTGEMGLSAVPGREDDARKAIDDALDYADKTQTHHVHIMAGIAEGAAAEHTFLKNLDYAAQQARHTHITLLIEPLNPHDNPGYFLSSLVQAHNIITDVGAAHLKLMFDIYHIQRSCGDICKHLSDYFDIIGHIQFAAPPHRGAPDEGELDFKMIFSHLETLGYQRPLGAEYRPKEGNTDASLGWMDVLR